MVKGQSKYPIGFGCGSRLHNIWRHMIKRCYHPTVPAYKYYGLRGISVCEKWRYSYSCFVVWALDRGYQESLSIERIDVDGNYEPCNCEWIPLDAQARNKRSSRKIRMGNEIKTIAEWGADPRCLVPYNTFRDRINNGRPIEWALSAPQRSDVRRLPISSEARKNMSVAAHKVWKERRAK